MDMTAIIYTIIIVAAAGFLYSRLPPVKGLRTLRSDAFKQELNNTKDILLVDVREPYEYKSGSIPEAVNIPLSQLGTRLKDIPQNRSVYLYCQSGMRSKQAARVLRGGGYMNLAHLQGGISAWNGPIKR